MEQIDKSVLKIYLLTSPTQDSKLQPLMVRFMNSIDFAKLRNIFVFFILTSAL